MRKIFLYYSIFLSLSTFNIVFSSEAKKSEISNETYISNLDRDAQIKSEYILGESDEIYIDFIGLPIFSSIYTINPEGNIILPEIKAFKASGKTINEIENELIEKYSDIIFDPELLINITKYRPVNVFIYGEVNKPGLYKISESNFFSSFYRNSKFDLSGSKNLTSILNQTTVENPKLYDALQASNGLTNAADLSKIAIIRKNSLTQGGGNIKTNIDLLSMITSGDQGENIRLLDGDTIFVPKSKTLIKDQVLAINRTNLSPDKLVVYITGNVRQGGQIILNKGTSLNQAIASTGGKKIMTGKIEFIRFNADGSTLKRKFNYNSKAEINSTKNPILMEGDIINVRRTIIGKTTEILGEISSPILSGYGLYSIFE